MRKLKLVLKLLGVVFVILLLALAAVIFTFDPNNYKDAITAQVEKQTGRDFRIDGDISLSVFPWIGVKVENVELANAEGFSDQPFARIAQLDVKVMLLPSFELRVTTVPIEYSSPLMPLQSSPGRLLVKSTAIACPAEYGTINMAPISNVLIVSIVIFTAYFNVWNWFDINETELATHHPNRLDFVKKMTYL